MAEEKEMQSFSIKWIIWLAILGIIISMVAIIAIIEHDSSHNSKIHRKIIKPSRYSSGTIDIPAGTGIYSTELKPQKGERWLFKSLSDRKAVLWDSRGKGIAIPHGGKVLICSKITGTGLEFLKNKQQTRVAYTRNRVTQ